MVALVIASGNRDPSRFPSPDTFDLDRKRTAHLTFSSGPHLCIGHVLGRTEIRSLTEEWLKRIPAFNAVRGEPHTTRLGTVLAIERLPLEWQAA